MEEREVLYTTGKNQKRIVKQKYKNIEKTRSPSKKRKNCPFDLDLDHAATKRSRGEVHEATPGLKLGIIVKKPEKKRLRSGSGKLSEQYSVKRCRYWSFSEEKTERKRKRCEEGKLSELAPTQVKNRRIQKSLVAEEKGTLVPKLSLVSGSESIPEKGRWNLKDDSHDINFHIANPVCGFIFPVISSSFDLYPLCRSVPNYYHNSLVDRIWLCMLPVPVLLPPKPPPEAVFLRLVGFDRDNVEILLPWLPPFACVKFWDDEVPRVEPSFTLRLGRRLLLGMEISIANKFHLPRSISGIMKILYPNISYPAWNFWDFSASVWWPNSLFLIFTESPYGGCLRTCCLFMYPIPVVANRTSITEENPPQPGHFFDRIPVKKKMRYTTNIFPELPPTSCNGEAMPEHHPRREGGAFFSFSLSMRSLPGGAWWIRGRKTAEPHDKKPGLYTGIWNWTAPENQEDRAVLGGCFQLPDLGLGRFRRRVSERGLATWHDNLESSKIIMRSNLYANYFWWLIGVHVERDIGYERSKVYNKWASTDQGSWSKVKHKNGLEDEVVGEQKEPDKLEYGSSFTSQVQDDIFGWNSGTKGNSSRELFNRVEEGSITRMISKTRSIKSSHPKEKTTRGRARKKDKTKEANKKWRYLLHKAHKTKRTLMMWTSYNQARNMNRADDNLFKNHDGREPDDSNQPVSPGHATMQTRVEK